MLSVPGPDSCQNTSRLTLFLGLCCAGMMSDVQDEHYHSFTFTLLYNQNHER